MQFETSGYTVTRPLISEGECAVIIARLNALSGAGTRNILQAPWCAELARDIANNPKITPLMPRAAAAVQCTLFEKSPSQNWLVALHQDVSIPVAARVEDPALQGWSFKEGILFVQPPASVLEQLVAVRIQLDECEGAEGALRVVAGSHIYGRMRNDAAYALRDRTGETVCPVPRGAALVMRPLILHASSKLTTTGTRRVLHFLFGSRHLPLRLEWAFAV